MRSKCIALLLVNHYYCHCYHWLLPLTLRVQCKIRWVAPVRVYKQWLTLSLGGVYCWYPEAKYNFNRSRTSTNANKNIIVQPQGALTTLCILHLNNKLIITLLQPRVTTTFFPNPRNPSASQASNCYPSASQLKHQAAIQDKDQEEERIRRNGGRGRGYHRGGRASGCSGRFNSQRNTNRNQSSMSTDM